jgi:hypothetical protein
MRRLRIFRIIIALVSLTQLCQATSALAAGGYDAVMYRKLPRFIALEVAMRGFSHYVQTREAWTPPQAVMIDFQAAYWYQSYFAIYGLMGIHASGAWAKETGVGLKLPLAFFDNPRGFFTSMRFGMDFEVVRYQTEVPTDPYWLYESSGLQIRYGGGMTFFFLKERYFLDMNFLATRFSSNWCIAPFIGLGLNI